MMAEKLVLDLETQRDFNEVDGRKLELLGVSVVGVYSYEENRYEAYLEADVKTKLAPRLQQAELLIGFNIRRFDLPVLQPYLPYPVTPLPVLDIMEEIVKNLGHRVSLESVSQATLGRGKSGHGLDALRWFKEGRFDLITKYCLDDVKLTKEVYDYGKEHGRLFATNRFGSEKLQFPVFWPDRKRELGAIGKMLAEAFEKRLQVEIEYLSPGAPGGEPTRRTRRIDVYAINEPYFEGYCHFRNDIRQFRIDRVLDIKPTWQRYTVPTDFIPTSVAE
jgi:DEAD/DEAH box helicase domain-containing protein